MQRLLSGASKHGMDGSKKSNVGEPKVTLSGLLNVIDGVGSEEGKLFFATVSCPLTSGVFYDTDLLLFFLDSHADILLYHRQTTSTASIPRFSARGASI
jgi:hypothetical protein